eukprot:CAMPEP_0119046112 /NCGR_PEP_ID=MMETSP1177-20130426/44458_1 /TAXON_ID=2985 /ORGANISM="Ochromonas sp, Strain CCMP1899" /LENGTH=218 /DNA_ID=CAMNT_0007018791 /DNA_START=66 /DNA_END=719 /DNA_ORIENTATION=-
MEVVNDHATTFMKKANANVDLLFQSVAVLPGDDMTALVTGLRRNIKLGAGLHQVGETVFSSIAGSLRYKAPITYWIESDKRIYVPQVGDQVVGVVEEKLGEFYKVNIFSSSTALLNKLAFEGATKRNKPELKKGDIIYLRVSVAHKDLQTEVTCISSSGSKKEWSTGETVYAELAEGLLVNLSVGRARKMLLPDCVVLNSLGRHFLFEVAIGMNGGIW